MCVTVAQLCPTLCDPMDYTVHGILQARILQWVAFPFSRGIIPTQESNPGLAHCRQILYQLSHKGSLSSSKASVSFPLNRPISSLPMNFKISKDFCLAYYPGLWLSAHILFPIHDSLFFPKFSVPTAKKSGLEYF